MIRRFSLAVLASTTLAALGLAWAHRAELRALCGCNPFAGLLVCGFIWFASSLIIVCADEWIVRRREQEERNHARIKGGVRTSAQIVRERGRPVSYSEIDRRRKLALRRAGRTPFADVPLD